MNTSVNHRQKLCYVEEAPDEWPKGWAFGPMAPLPPGWPKKLHLPGVKLLAGVVDDQIVLRVQDKWDEATGALDGYAVRFQAASGRELLRMRMDEEAPWSEQMVFVVRNGGVAKKVLFDWERAEIPSAGVLIQTYGIQPSLSVSLRVKRV